VGLSLEEEREVLLGGLKGGRETRCGHLRVDESHRRSARPLHGPLRALLCVIDEAMPSLAVRPPPPSSSNSPPHRAALAGTRSRVERLKD
jgi:hypothetical protein